MLMITNQLEVIKVNKVLKKEENSMLMTIDIPKPLLEPPNLYITLKEMKKMNGLL